jgi:hypothetical protein
MTKSRGRVFFISKGRLYVHGDEQDAMCLPNSYIQAEERKKKFKLGMIAVKRKRRKNGRQESCKIVTSVFSLQLLV